MGCGVWGVGCGVCGLGLRGSKDHRSRECLHEAVHPALPVHQAINVQEDLGLLRPKRLWLLGALEPGAPPVPRDLHTILRAGQRERPDAGCDAPSEPVAPGPLRDDAVADLNPNRNFLRGELMHALCFAEAS